MQIRKIVINLIREAIPGHDSFEEKNHLYLDLGLDSLAFVQLLLRIEETFSITFGILEMESCLQVDRLIALAKFKVEENEHTVALLGKEEAS